MSSTLKPSSTPVLKTKVTLLAIALMTSIGAAQAQSSYALTKLNPPFLGRTNPYVAGSIDSQNRVTASTDYLSGFSLYRWGADPGPTYTTYIARWSASTAASVSPRKLISQPNFFKHQSRDGTKVFGRSDSAYYDTAKGQFVEVPAPYGSESAYVRSINSSGVMVGTAIVYATNPNSATLRAVRWMPGASAPEVLPISGEFNRSSASVINEQGAVAGEVGLLGSEQLLAASWPESGAFELPNNESDTNSHVEDLSDSGDLLVYLKKEGADYGGYAVISHGVTKLIEAPNADVVVGARSINANGVVVGTLTQYSLPQEYRDRGFIWKDGVLTDLTDWVTAKGVKLPKGAVIAVPFQINAQGSIVAALRDSDGNTSLIRLTAKP